MIVDLFELLHLLEWEVFGVEAVLAGVLVAGLAAAFALGRFVLVALFFFIATEIVE